MSYFINSITTIDRPQVHVELPRAVAVYDVSSGFIGNPVRETHFGSVDIFGVRRQPRTNLKGYAAVMNEKQVDHG